MYVDLTTKYALSGYGVPARCLVVPDALEGLLEWTEVDVEKLILGFEDGSNCWPEQDVFSKDIVVSDAICRGRVMLSA